MANAVALMRRYELEPRIAIARDVIDRQLKQMSHLVDDLLDVSRITSGKIHLETKPVQLDGVIAQAVEAVETLVNNRSHQLTVDLGDSEIWVAGDRVRLVQIVTNLLNNAAKFTQRNGRISVTLRVVGDRVEIRVKDNGPGIAEELRTDIFKPFFQGAQDVSRSDGGLGLGLALTRQLAALHGGDVAAYSKGRAGEGSEFVVRLPMIAAPAEAKPKSADAPKKILVVDDNRDSADTMCLLLQTLGYEARSVYNGNAALATVISGAPDVVLLDIGLPEMSGLEVAQRIRAELIDPPKLVAVSGYGQTNDREATFKAGFYAHLSKPVDMEELAHLLKRIFS
jgi:CheY-like chemotaxis protein